MPTVQLGNVSVIERRKAASATEARNDGALEALDQLKPPSEGEPVDYTVDRSDLGQRITTYIVPETESRAGALAAIRGTWNSHHSNEAPAWVESDDEFLAQLVADELDCEVGRPEDWEESVSQDIPEGARDEAADAPPEEEEE